MHRQYNTDLIKRAIIIVLITSMVVAVGWMIGTAECRAAEEQMITCWAMCMPKSHVDVHMKPDKDSKIVGYLDPGDSFHTDGESKNGFIWCDVGDGGEGWVYCGYVSTEEPEKVNERYVCVALKQVACRRWIHGPQIKGRGAWLKNMSTVMVYFRTSEWSVTNRGYIKSEWLEVDPE